MKKPQRPPDWDHLIQQFDRNRLIELVSSGIGPAPGGQYRHWDTLRRIQPPPELTTEEWWLAVKMARRATRRTLPLNDKTGKPFHYTMPEMLLEMLPQIDRYAAGQILLPEPVTNPQTRDRYVINSLIEEAITSSQLEGAISTREVARDMIRSGRTPINRSERMILNNYLAMQHIGEVKAEPLTPALIIGLHRAITEGTLIPAENYLRKPDDGIGVYDNANNELLHCPPHALEIPARMAAMCRFANEGIDGAFLHPVLRAIILHFWLAYDHPFVDGNGRTARALFYWSMLSQGFWLFEYVSISSILRKAPARYGRSFLYTETDENDLTYFVLSQLRVLCRAIDELKSYLGRKMEETRQTTTLLHQSIDLNHRQIALLGHALRHPGMHYTYASHRRSHKVTYQTARTDLLDLVERALLIHRKRGRAFAFEAPRDLRERLTTLR